MKFRLGWWNTHLSPPGRSEVPPQDHIEETIQTIEALFNRHDIDLVCLGEINPSASEKISSMLKEKLIKLDILEGKEDRSVFNMAVAYRPDKVQFAAPIFEFDVIAGSKSKIAARMVSKLEDGSVIVIFIVHWTSRLYEGVETEKRTHLAQSLRRRIDAILDEDEDAKVIILGDFNDEPYDLSLSRYLLASRDVRRVIKDRRLLYNPFWRSLTSAGRYTLSGLPEKASGTYYYRSGRVHRWHTFDQIVFSSAFLGGGEWHLNEENTAIMGDVAGLITNLENGGHFDHYPVLAAIEKARK